VSSPAAGQPKGSAQSRITLIGLGLLACLTLLSWWTPRLDDRLQSAAFDSYQRLKPREIEATPVMVVEIDEPSLARLGQWPWPRTRLAELIHRIAQHAPLAIGIDILMPEPDRLSPERLLQDARQRDSVPASQLELLQLLQSLPSNDSELARAIAAGSVVLPVVGTPDRSSDEPMVPPFIVVDRARGAGQADDVAAGVPHFAGARMNIPELDRAAAGHGVISAAPGENVIRRLPLVVRLAERLAPSFATEMMRVALGVPDIRLYARGRAVEAIAIGRFVVPPESDGQIRLYYSGRDPRRRVSALDVLDGTVDPERLQSKLVLVATAGLALVDYQHTPLGERMPGTEVHAQLLENLVGETWLTRPAWAPWAELGVLVLLGLALVWATPRWKPGHLALLAVGCIAIPVLAGIGAFLWLKLVFDAATPSLALLILFGGLLVPTLAEASRQRRALERTIQLQREQAAYVAGELEAARRIQLGFLPRPDALRDDPRVEIAASMTPAREVGGDLYDFFRVDEDRLFFLIGDVSGKGVSASLFMAVGKALCKSITLRNPRAPISELMRAANEELSRDNPELFFVTAFAGILDLDSGALAYSNAGHDNPYLMSSRRKACPGPDPGPGPIDGTLPTEFTSLTDVPSLTDVTQPIDATDVTRLTDAGGPPLCTVDDFPYLSAHQPLQSGDLLCLVTDGVTDAQNPDGERYGSERLQQLLARQPIGVSAQTLVDAIGADLRTFIASAEPADDLTILALRWSGPVAHDTSHEQIATDAIKHE
jgi:serine phosphatase RsbU (regulator of sigma subunit)/CHASE2 domain-containing sensor protein